MSFREIKKTLLNNTPRKIFYMAKWKVVKKRPVKQFDDQRPCVFVLSTGRVGSETLAYLLGLAKHVFVSHEPRPELFALSRLAYELSDQYPDNENLERALCEGFLTARREILNNSLYCDRGYVETGPQATFLAPVILKAIPEIRFIHLVRDPRKVVRSAMRRGWYDGHDYDFSRIVPSPDSEMGRLWEHIGPFQKNLWLWAETNRWILNFSKSLSEKQYLLVHSEDIFNAHEDTVNQLYRFLGTTTPSSRKIGRVLGKQLNAQTRGTFIQPDDWLSHTEEELSAFVSQISSELKYDLS